MEKGISKSLPKHYYLSDEIFGLEKERIFFKEWFCAGRAEELPEPGSYLVVEIAGESILVVRTKTGSLKAFYNVCRHRGCRLVLGAVERPHGGDDDASGRFKGHIRCPYHSWTYDLQGTLKGAPFSGDIPDFDPADFSLHPVKVETWGGFFFVCLSDDPTSTAPTLGTALGAVPERLKRYPLEALRSAKRITYDVTANWKVVMENYNECYHCAGVHPELCRIVPAFRAQGGASLDWDSGVPHREGAYTFTATGTTTRAPFPGLSQEEKVRHKGELVYPNLLLSLASDHVAAFLLWPQDPSRTLITCDFLFHPDELAKDSFDPTDAVDFWDLVNRQDWAVCGAVQSGMTSRVFDYGHFAPMEDMSLDIRKYVESRLGPPPNRTSEVREPPHRRG
jgi:glycine betaine catabolism A